jgi:hypothetical protein
MDVIPINEMTNDAAPITRQEATVEELVDEEGHVVAEHVVDSGLTEAAVAEALAAGDSEGVVARRKSAVVQELAESFAPAPAIEEPAVAASPLKDPALKAEEPAAAPTEDADTELVAQRTAAAAVHALKEMVAAAAAAEDPAPAEDPVMAEPEPATAEPEAMAPTAEPAEPVESVAPVVAAAELPLEKDEAPAITRQHTVMTGA